MAYRVTFRGDPPDSCSVCRFVYRGRKLTADTCGANARYLPPSGIDDPYYDKPDWCQLEVIEDDEDDEDNEETA